MNAVVAESSEAGTGKTATIVEKVQMEDGTEVSFSGKRKLLKSSSITDDGVLTRLDFRNGRVILFTIPPNLLKLFAAHGAEQKLGDETAGTEDVEDMVLDVEALVKRLQNGEWNVTREGGGNAGTSILLRALVEFTGKTPEQIKLWLQGDESQGYHPDTTNEKGEVVKGAMVKPGLTNKEKLALRNSKELKPIVDRLEAEKATKGPKVDTGALLAGLG